MPSPLNNWVPGRDDVQNHQCQMRVDNPDGIFNILLRQNFSQLIKSRHSVFVQGNIKTAIGWDAASEIAKEILDGAKNSTLNHLGTNSSQPLGRFIQSMAKIQNKSKEKIDDMPWTYGIEEYKDTFSKTRESTACGPSGIHMGHWKAALESRLLMRVHSFFIWSAFTFGFS